MVRKCMIVATWVVQFLRTVTVPARVVVAR